MSGAEFTVLYVFILAGLFVAALLTGKRWLLLVPAIGWPAFYPGLTRGWWGYGVGDGWEYTAILVTLGGVAGVGLGLVMNRARRGSAH